MCQVKYPFTSLSTLYSQVYRKRSFLLQGISSQTVISNLAQREEKTDILRKFKPILISKLTAPKNKWEIMKNYKKC